MKNIKLDTIKLNFTKKRLRVIKITKIVRIITLLFPIIIAFLLLLKPLRLFQWMLLVIAFILIIASLLWIILSIILYYSPINHILKDILEVKDELLIIKNPKISKEYNLIEIRTIYHAKVSNVIFTLGGDYFTQKKISYLFIHLKKGEHIEFHVEKDSPQLKNFLSLLNQKGIKVNETERFAVFR